jgi:SAM-dependent methyltransferase
MAGRDDLAALLDEQAAFYQAVAAEYEDHALPFPGGGELSQALDAFRPTGSVLELACGPGTWTTQLLRHATDVTAVDASAERLGIALAATGRRWGRLRSVAQPTQEPRARRPRRGNGRGVLACSGLVVRTEIRPLKQRHR